MNLSEQHRLAFDGLFDVLYKGDTAAKELSFLLLEVAHTWDDLVDDDKKLSSASIDNAFLASLIYIPGHRYWSPALQSMLLSVYLRWHAANCIEADTTATDNELSKAWMLRAGLFDLFLHLALQLHGMEWAKGNARLVWQYYAESLESFILEVAHA